jgi:hypothetical protein
MHGSEVHGLGTFHSRKVMKGFKTIEKKNGRIHLSLDPNRVGNIEVWVQMGQKCPRITVGGLRRHEYHFPITKFMVQSKLNHSDTLLIQTLSATADTSYPSNVYEMHPQGTPYFSGIVSNPYNLDLAIYIPNVNLPPQVQCEHQ